MGIMIAIIMYGLWILAIIFVLATTFTKFAYIDLNVFAILTLAIALINSFFTSKRAH